MKWIAFIVSFALFHVRNISCAALTLNEVSAFSLETLPLDIKHTISHFLSEGKIVESVLPLESERCNRYTTWHIHFPETAQVKFMPHICSEVGGCIPGNLSFFSDVYCLSRFYPQNDDSTLSVSINKKSSGIKSSFELYRWQPLSSFVYIKSFFKERSRSAYFQCWDAFFDGEFLHAAIVTNLSITFLSAAHIFGLHSQKFTSCYYFDAPKNDLSLCVHNCHEARNVSLIHKGSMKLFGPDSFEPQHINCSLQDIRKHEYIGAGTYVILTKKGFLYFAQVQNSELQFWKQTIKYANKTDCFVQDFSVNQDPEKKTCRGRSRFIALLIDGGKLFLLYLLSKNNSIKALTYFFKPVDKVSFFKNTVSVWLKKQMKEGRFIPFHVTLNPHWAKQIMFDSQSFTGFSKKASMHSFWGTLRAFLLDYKEAVIIWIAAYVCSYHKVSPIIFQNQKIRHLLAIALAQVGIFFINSISINRCFFGFGYGLLPSESDMCKIFLPYKLLCLLMHTIKNVLFKKP